MGDTLIEGKTKVVTSVGMNRAKLKSKDDWTAGDGKRHEVVPGKGRTSNQTAVNVFEMLRVAGIPLAYLYQYDDESFIAEECRMLPWEVVVRRRARGSILKRHTSMEDGHLFDPPKVEFYLKTKDRVWTRASGVKLKLRCDDPFAEIIEDGVLLYDAGTPYGQASYIGWLDDKDVHHEDDYKWVKHMEELALRTFLVLEKAFSLLSIHLDLDDFKVEFGVNKQGRLLIADVIDCDAWRLLFHGEHLDKQPFRRGEDAEKSLRRYRFAEGLTSRFPEVYDRLRVWASEQEKLAA